MYVSVPEMSVSLARDALLYNDSVGRLPRARTRSSGHSVALCFKTFEDCANFAVVVNVAKFVNEGPLSQMVALQALDASPKVCGSGGASYLYTRMCLQRCSFAA